MYTNTIDETTYIELMNNLKELNIEYKRLQKSNSYKYGLLINEIKVGLKSPKNICSLFKKIKDIYFWRRLCKKYPIASGVSKTYASKSNYFINDKIVIYTSVFGKYDFINEPIVKPNNCDYIVITDQIVSDTSVWKKRNFDDLIPNFNKLTNVEKNRYCKMFPHVLFSEYKYSIYIDGNIKVITDLTEFVNVSMENGIQFHKHKARDCVYQELVACKVLKKAKKEELKRFEVWLNKEEFPRNYGMAECNVIVRDHSNKVMQKIMTEWWCLFKNGNVKRDQLVLPYVLWKNGIDVCSVTQLGENVENNPAIRVVSHNQR